MEKEYIETNDLVINKEKLKELIVDRYGTMAHFCRKNNLNIGSFKVWLVRGYKSRIYTSIIREQFKEAIVEDKSERRIDKILKEVGSEV